MKDTIVYRDNENTLELGTVDVTLDDSCIHNKLLKQSYSGIIELNENTPKRLKELLEKQSELVNSGQFFPADEVNTLINQYKLVLKNLNSRIHDLYFEDGEGNFIVYEVIESNQV